MTEFYCDETTYSGFDLWLDKEAYEKEMKEYDEMMQFREEVSKKEYWYKNRNYLKGF